jgi:hypothetical protein
LRTLKKLNATPAQKAHVQFYDDGKKTILRDPAAAAADAAAAAGNGPIQGQGGHQLGHGGGALPALQIPPTPDFQKDTRPRVESMSDCKGDYKNAFSKF